MKVIEPIRLTKNQRTVIEELIETKTVKDLNVAYNLAREYGLDPSDLLSATDGQYITLDTLYIMKANEFTNRGLM